MAVAKRTLIFSLPIALIWTLGCAKKVRFTPLPLAKDATANVRVQLTYDRNNVLQAKFSKLPEPSTINPKYSIYVLWVAAPDRKNAVNVGRIRVDEQHNAKLETLTPRRDFMLFVTAESDGEATTPSPDILFETRQIIW